MSFPNDIGKYSGHGFSEVSILVLVDVLPEPRYQALASWTPLRVSILVLVDVLPELGDGDLALVSGRVVSILVLVDVLPELSPSRWAGNGSPSFNPCFSGCPSRTYKHLRPVCGFNLLFQSLF